MYLLILEMIRSWDRKRRAKETKTASAPPDADSLSGLTLAYVGDAVWELIVREHALRGGEKRMEDLHKASVEMAKAPFQAQAVKKLLPLLTEEELTAYRRGRNAKPGHVPKNSTHAQYSEATGFEALFGRLYLTGQADRIEELASILTEDGNE